MSRTGFGCFASALCLLLSACNQTELPTAAPATTLSPAYVGSDSCRTCHEDQYVDWLSSHHRQAMQPATAATVVGDFTGTTFEYGDVAYEFSESDGRYRLKADDENGEMREFEISHTFGIEPLQQYLVPFPGGRLQALSVAWDSRPAHLGGQRWFHLYPDDAITHDDELHWTGRNFNWNFMCADCHSTQLRKNYDPVTRTYATSWAEVNVGCEACHGPGSLHIAKASGDAYDETGFDAALATQPGEVGTCAKCHSRRSILAEGFGTGDPLLDFYRPALLDASLYHADGQILDEVYVFGSFLQSKMHQRGVRCSDCHNPHSGKLKVAGNGTCTACHQSNPPPRFPSLRSAVYDHPDHHFHEPGSEGAQCVNCHMPAKLYMVVDARRDHGFRIPRPDIAASTGAPNACNDCHVDMTTVWAAQAIERHFAGPKPEHFGEALAAGRLQQTDALSPLVRLAGDSDAADIVRATALSLLGEYDHPDAIAAIADGLQNRSGLMRLGALAGAESLDIEQRWSVAAHLLDDELLAVRSEAAVTLAPILDYDLRQADLERLLLGLDTYIDSQRLNEDRPEAQTNLGNTYARLDRHQDAERAFQSALEIEPNWVPALVNLADFYRGRNRDAEAGPLLDRAVELAPGNAAVRFARGLLLVRLGRSAAALEDLQAAARLSPDTARYTYVYGIALNSTGYADEAVRVLEGGNQRFPADSEILFALATIERDRGNTTSALEYVETLLSLQPGSPRLLQFRRELEAALKN